MEPKIIPPNPEAVKIAERSLDIIELCAKAAAKALDAVNNPVLVAKGDITYVRFASTGEVIVGRK